MMPDVQAVKNRCIRIGQKGITCTYPLAQSTVCFRAVNADGIDLDTIFADVVIIVLKLFQLHTAKGSPVATIKKI